MTLKREHNDSLATDSKAKEIYEVPEKESNMMILRKIQ